MWHMTWPKWLAQLEVAEHGVLIPEPELDPTRLTTLTAAGLVEYAGLASYSDCCDCACGPGCPVERLGGSDDDPEYVALCPLGQALVYRTADLRRWRLTIQGVVRFLAAQLEQSLPTDTLLPHRLWAVGALSPRVRLGVLRGVRSHEAPTVRAAVTAWLQGRRGILLIPGEHPLTGVIPEQAIAVPLREVLQVEPTGITVDRAALASLAAQLAGESVAPILVPLPVPAGFSWAQLRLEVVSYEHVRIWTTGEAVLKSYRDLGLANTRDGTPKKGWHLFREFAGHDGIYDAAHPSGLYPPTRPTRPGTPALSGFSEKLGPALSDLGEHMQRLFPGIPGKPFARYDAQRHQYRAIVQLSWEPGYRQQRAQELSDSRR